MAGDRRTLVGDLASSVRTALEGARSGDAAPDLAVLEREHRVLCDRRRRLHEIIDGLEAVETLKRDSAAMLERFKISEKDVSWRRGILYREILERRGRATDGVTTG